MIERVVVLTYSRTISTCFPRMPAFLRPNHQPEQPSYNTWGVQCTKRVSFGGMHLFISHNFQNGVWKQSKWIWTDHSATGVCPDSVMGEQHSPFVSFAFLLQLLVVALSTWFKFWTYKAEHVMQSAFVLCILTQDFVLHLHVQPSVSRKLRSIVPVDSTHHSMIWSFTFILLATTCNPRLDTSQK